jgi:hypothetical protein
LKIIGLHINQFLDSIPTQTISQLGMYENHGREVAFLAALDDATEKTLSAR